MHRKKVFFSFDFERKEHGVSKHRSFSADKGLGMNKKKSGGGHFCSAPFFLSKSALKYFLTHLTMFYILREELI